MFTKRGVYGCRYLYFISFGAATKGLAMCESLVGWELAPGPLRSLRSRTPKIPPLGVVVFGAENRSALSTIGCRKGWRGGKLRCLQIPPSVATK